MIWAVKDKESFGLVKLFADVKPWVERKHKKWVGASAPLVIDKNDLPVGVKIEWGDEPVQLAMTLCDFKHSELKYGCKVSYKTFDFCNWLFGGMIYGGNYKKHVVEVLGINWFDEEFLVRKHNDKKPRWYSWKQFEIE